MQKIKLAEALLRRKELQQKVDRIKVVKDADIFEVVTQRRAVHEGIDDVIAKIPKLELNQVTKEYDYYAKQLRRIDAAIQQTNWTANIEIDNVMEDYNE